MIVTMDVIDSRTPPAAQQAALQAGQCRHGQNFGGDGKRDQAQVGVAQDGKRMSTERRSSQPNATRPASTTATTANARTR